MDQIRLEKQAEGVPAFAKPFPGRHSSANIVNQHPQRFALEQLDLGDKNYCQHDWVAAKSNYATAVDTLERMPFSNPNTLRQGFQRLAKAHLKLFEFKAALSCYVRSQSCLKSICKESVEAESTALMAKIKAARKTGKVADDEGYTPSFYSGPL